MNNTVTRQFVACAAIGVVACFGTARAADAPPGGGAGPGKGRNGNRVQTTGPTAGKSGFDAAREDYRRILDDVAAGSTTGPRDISDMQRAAFAEKSLDGLNRLHRYQLAMITALGARDPRAALPIVWMHYEAAGQHVGAREWALRVPSLILASDMASSMGRFARSAEDRDFAAGVMLCSGYSFLGDGDKMRACNLFDRAARFDPGNAAALLGSAAIHERFGRYPLAVERLERLVKAEPSNAEGRLRLAVNLVRVDEGDEAVEIFAGLVTGDTPSWINEVASQELANCLLRRGEIERALGILEQAVARHPDNSGLAIQLAMVMDRSGRAAEAALLVNGVAPARAKTVAGPRWRYAAWPAFERHEYEVRLRNQAASAAPALARSLAAIPVGSAS